MNKKLLTLLLPCCISAYISAFSAGLSAQPDGGEQDRSQRMQQVNNQLNSLTSDLARALGHPGFRGLIRAEIARAKTREQIVKLDDVLDKAGRGSGKPPNLDQMQTASRTAGAQFRANGSELMGGLDLYFPIPADRERWQGGIDMLVTFAPAHEKGTQFKEITAYSVKTGEQVVLDASSPPDLPVLVIAPEEHETHEIDPNPAAIVDLPKMAPDADKADPTEKPIPQEKGNSYVGIKYLNILETKEWWWEGAPEIYMLFGIRKGNNCIEGKIFLSEVDRTDTWYNLWSRSTPAKWYFDSTYSNNLLLYVIERDYTGYQKLQIDEIYPGITCEWTVMSDDDFFPRYRNYLLNFEFSRDYFQIDGLLGQYWAGWRKEH